MARHSNAMACAWRAAFTGAAISALAACAPLVNIGGADAPPARIFDIEARGGAANDMAATSQRVILIEEPTTTNILDRDRIAVRLPGGEIQYLSGVRFADRPARLIRRVIKDDIDAVDGYTALGRGSIDVASDYRLKLTVRDFQVRKLPNLTERSVVSLQVLLLNTSGDLIASRIFEQSEAISSTAPDAVIAGLRSGLLSVSAQMRDWVLSTIET